MPDREWFNRVIKHKEEEIQALEDRIHRLETELSDLKERAEAIEPKTEILLEVVE